jgi:hypothetical protein
MLTLSVLLPSVTVPCNDDEGCSLLGRCVAGDCQCRTGWTGESCSVGDFEPLDVTLGYHNESQSSWGGRPILDLLSGRWQLMVMEIKNHCPLILFEYNSMVVRAISRTGDAGGPYDHAEVVLPPFHHNPTFVGPTPDGYYLLFYIGTDRPQAEIDCRQEIPDVPKHPIPPLASNGYTMMAYTKDIVRGPWTQKLVLRNNAPPLSTNQSLSWRCNMGNPSAAILPNGTVVLVFRANAVWPQALLVVVWVHDRH